MLTSGTIQRTIGTTKQHGAKNAVFYTFFSKKAPPPTFSPTDCTQTISAKIPCLSFTGKERDEETGYGYFGARYMDHELTAMWLSVDPMADKYPSISPYAYCAWNPVKLVDPNGMEINPVYTINGDYLGNTIEGFTGDPLIMNKNDYETMMGVSEATNISELSVDDVRTYGGTTFDDVVKRGSALSGDAQEKIIKNIISQYRDPQISFFFNVGFNGSDVAKKMKYDVDNTELKGKYNFGTNSSSIYFKHNNWNYEFTVENITASVVYHEWLGHDKMEWGNGIEMAEKKASDGGTHYACYLSVMTSPIWQKTTKSYKKFNEKMFNYFFQ